MKKKREKERAGQGNEKRAQIMSRRECIRLVSLRAANQIYSTKKNFSQHRTQPSLKTSHPNTDFLNQMRRHVESNGKTFFEKITIC